MIRNAPVSLVADFYRDYYRPERAALVVVGDIDPDAIESEIKARFSDWNPGGTGRPDPDYGTPQKRGQEALVFTEAGAPQSIAVYSAPSTCTDLKSVRSLLPLPTTLLV